MEVEEARGGKGVYTAVEEAREVDVVVVVFVELRCVVVVDREVPELLFPDDPVVAAIAGLLAMAEVERRAGGRRPGAPSIASGL